MNDKKEENKCITFSEFIDIARIDEVPKWDSVEFPDRNELIEFSKINGEKVIQRTVEQIMNQIVKRAIKSPDLTYCVYSITENINIIIEIKKIFENLLYDVKLIKYLDKYELYISWESNK
jgi:hypothetical protein